MELYDAALALGLEMDHHESDLYICVTPESTVLLRGYAVTVHRFSDRDGRSWYDVPFAYAPFWRARVTL